MDTIEILTIAIIIFASLSIVLLVTIPVTISELNRVYNEHFKLQQNHIADYKELNR